MGTVFQVTATEWDALRPLVEAPPEPSDQPQEDLPLPFAWGVADRLRIRHSVGLMEGGDRDRRGCGTGIRWWAGAHVLHNVQSRRGGSTHNG
jgi:hypothetical protein